MKFFNNNLEMRLRSKIERDFNYQVPQSNDSSHITMNIDELKEMLNPHIAYKLPNKFALRRPSVKVRSQFKTHKHCRVFRTPLSELSLRSETIQDDYLLPAIPQCNLNKISTKEKINLKHSLITQFKYDSFPETKNAYSETSHNTRKMSEQCNSRIKKNDILSRVINNPIQGNEILIKRLKQILKITHKKNVNNQSQNKKIIQNDWITIQKILKPIKKLAISRENIRSKSNGK